MFLHWPLPIKHPDQEENVGFKLFRTQVRLPSDAANTRVARWNIFRPKIPIAEGLAMEDVSIYYDH
jgi:hypothetical protein